MSRIKSFTRPSRRLRQNHKIPFARKQEEKLDLEIEDLRKRSRWSPIIATLLGIAGFFFTVVQFQCQHSHQLETDRTSREDAQRKDRTVRELEQLTRLQNQIRTDIDEILRSAHDETQATARVLFLLQDIKTVMSSKINEKEVFSDKFRHYDRSVTESLAILVRDDYDFSTHPRDVSRANVVIEHWHDYSDYLHADADKLDYILYKYTQALQNFRDQNIGYLECLHLDPETQQVQVCRKYERQKNDQALYDHVVDLVNGFKKHIELIGAEPLSEADTERKNKILLDFQEAMCNPDVSKHFIGVFLPGGTCIPRH